MVHSPTHVEIFHNNVDIHVCRAEAIRGRAARALRAPGTPRPVVWLPTKHHIGGFNTL